MEKLVSVIIPCFNAEKWLQEAIDSCLQQTYPHIEVIVIDDGSTDSSAEILSSYGSKITWQSGPNRGGNYARNSGFTLAKGDYIQYLDADDYLLPEKIAQQVRILEETKADLVYGDWRYQHHLPDSTSYLDEIVESGPRVDLLESILADRWIPPVALLFTREAVAKSDGWDESLKSAQDRDFLLAILMNGAKAAYQSGCYSIYRRYGTTTVSTSNKAGWLTSHWQIMAKAEKRLRQTNQLSPAYRLALAESYFFKCRYYSDYLKPFQYLGLLWKIVTLYPEFKADSDRFKTSKAYSFLQSKFGFLTAEISLRVKQYLVDRVSEMRKALQQGRSHQAEIPNLVGVKPPASTHSLQLLSAQPSQSQDLSVESN